MTKLIDNYADRAQTPTILYVDVFVYTVVRGEIQHLALRRRADVPLPSSWQPVCGKIQAQESVEAAFSRQVFEKTGQKPRRLLNLDRVSTFYDNYYDAVLMVPAAAAQVDSATIQLDESIHGSYEWFPSPHVEQYFVFDRQREYVALLQSKLVNNGFSSFHELRVG